MEVCRNCDYTARQNGEMPLLRLPVDPYPVEEGGCLGPAGSDWLRFCEMQSSIHAGTGQVLAARGGSSTGRIGRHRISARKYY